MAMIKFISKTGDTIQDTHERQHDTSSLQPLPRLIEEDGKKFRFDHRDGVVNVYKESNV